MEYELEIKKYSKPKSFLFLSLNNYQVPNKGMETANGSVMYHCYAHSLAGRL